MRRLILNIVLLLSVSIVALSATDTDMKHYSTRTVPNVHLQDARQYVSDPASLLSKPTRDSINALFATLEMSTGIEAAVVMLPSIGETDPFDFSVELFRQWGIGKKKNDNGLLILYVEDQHKIRFTTGYGLEGILTDAQSKRIQTRYMIPFFKRNDRNTGMLQGCKAVVSVLDGSMQPDNDTDEEDSWLAVLLLFVFIAGLGIFIFYQRKHVCPQCGKKEMRLTSTDYYRIQGVRYRKEIYTCRNCGKIVVKNIPDDDRHNDANDMMNAMFIGSLFGRNGGGGGFSGGSFGGGSTGGGGAGSSW